MENLFEGKYSNLWRVINNSNPVVGDPIFYDNQKNYEEVQNKIDNDLIGYKQHMIDASEKMKIWREKASQLKNKVSELKWYDQAESTRKFALKIVNDAAKFMKQFNKLYSELKTDLIGTDHKKVAQAIFDLYEIYPSQLIIDAGKLKRLRRMKYDRDFILSVLKWTNSIIDMYDNLTKGSKYLGKSKNQIAGMHKNSLNQKMRWGMY